MSEGPTTFYLYTFRNKYGEQIIGARTTPSQTTMGAALFNMGQWVETPEQAEALAKAFVAQMEAGRAAPAMYAALKRQHENIQRWLETGEPASAEESKSIADQIAAALELAKEPQG